MKILPAIFKKILIYSGVFLIIIESNKKPAYSFIPNVYEPNKKELEITSISITKTAAQLIYFGEVEKAKQLALLAIKINPKDHRIWAVLAESQVRNKELEEAIKSIKVAQKLDSNNEKYLFKEGFILMQQKKIVEAIKSIKKGLVIDPNNADAYFQLGNCMIMNKEFRSALNAFKKASEINPKFWQAINNEGLVLYEMDKIKEAIDTWKIVISIEEDAEPLLAIAAATYSESNKNNNSIIYAKKALIKNPSYASPEHQKEQLWGEKLREATKKLFKNPELSTTLKKALSDYIIKNNS